MGSRLIFLVIVHMHHNTRLCLFKRNFCSLVSQIFYSGTSFFPKRIKVFKQQLWPGQMLPMYIRLSLHYDVFTF